VWRTNETFADYLYDKMTLANRVPVEDAEIISYVIEGIRVKNYVRKLKCSAISR